MPDFIRLRTGWKTSWAMSSTASLGVQCSPASSLFSSLKRRTRSSKIVPMAWLSSAGSRTELSGFRTGSGLRLIWGERNRFTMRPSMSPLDSLLTWLRNSNFSRMSCTLGEKPSKYRLKSSRSCCCDAREVRSFSPNGEVLDFVQFGGLPMPRRRLCAATLLMSPKLSPYWTLLMLPENEMAQEVGVNPWFGLQPP